jgi:uncharacterized membrane protein YjdF
MSSRPEPIQAGPAEDPTALASRIDRWVVIITTSIMAIELAFLLWEGQWLNALLVIAIVVLIAGPCVLGPRLPVHVPAELHVLAVVFIFSALFLGEVRSYYERIWWWDIALHTSSGFLLGIVGFLLVFVLNENKRVHLQMRPRFVALFAFLFAVTVGVIWEIFEFSMDSIFGMDMQKTMLGDESGLTDTMFDLIVDNVGALFISGLGWWYMHRKEQSFIQSWIRKFIARNPQLFKGR